MCMMPTGIKQDILSIKITISIKSNSLKATRIKGIRFIRLSFSFGERKALIMKII